MKITKVNFVPRHWLVDMVPLSMEERGFYFTICAHILYENGPIPNNDKYLVRICGGNIRSIRRIKNSLIALGKLRAEGEKLTHDYCMDLIAEARRRQARSNLYRSHVFERDDHRCSYCGTTNGPLEVDHIIPVSRGGTNDPSNLTTSCMACNRDKGAFTVEEWRAARSGGLQ